MKNTPSRRIRQVPKLCGSDTELGNTIVDLDESQSGRGYSPFWSSGRTASRALLENIHGAGSGGVRSGGGSSWSTPQSQASSKPSGAAVQPSRDDTRSSGRSTGFGWPAGQNKGSWKPSLPAAVPPRDEPGTGSRSAGGVGDGRWGGASGCPSGGYEPGDGYADVSNSGSYGGGGNPGGQGAGPGYGSYGSGNYGSGNYGSGSYGSGNYGGYGAGYNNGYNYQDVGRRFLSNGGCAYIDMDHLEMCLPECLSAFQWVTYWEAMRNIASDSLTKANQGLAANGQKIRLLANNSDGHDSSWGGHLNILITRECFDNIFYYKLHQALFLASLQVSMIILTGQGKVGAENRIPDVSYQLTQRGDFVEQMMALQTTYARPLLNTRDEPLAGTWRSTSDASRELARAHIIFFDTNMAPVANVLKIGVLQIGLALIEAGRIKPDLLLDDPLDALYRWGRDPSLRSHARLANGQRVTALDVQWRFHELADEFAAEGGLDNIVPDHAAIRQLWGETLEMLEQCNTNKLISRLDWVLKKAILERAMDRNGLDWSSPEVKVLDHLYSSLDSDSLFEAYESVVEKLSDPADVRFAMTRPPHNTRAYARGRLLHEWSDRVTAVDWDSITLRMPGSFSTRCIELANPLGFTRDQTGDLFNGRTTLRDVLDTLEACSRIDLAVSNAPAPRIAAQHGAVEDVDALGAAADLVSTEDVAPERFTPERFAPERFAPEDALSEDATPEDAVAAGMPEQDAPVQEMPVQNAVPEFIPANILEEDIAASDNAIEDLAAQDRAMQDLAGSTDAETAAPALPAGPGDNRALTQEPSCPAEAGRQSEED